MLLDILTIACGLTLGFAFSTILYSLASLIKRMFSKKKITYKPTNIFTHDNKQFQKIEREEKTKK